VIENIHSLVNNRNLSPKHKMKYTKKPCAIMELAKKHINLATTCVLLMIWNHISWDYILNTKYLELSSNLDWF
jgi:hypothetical protein